MLNPRDGPANEPFRLGVPLDTIMTVQNAWELALKIENIPFAGLAHFFTVTEGYAYVMLLDVDDLLSAGAGIDSIASFLESNEEFYQSANAFSISKGEPSLF